MPSTEIPSSCELIVVGAGIVGLWVARKAALAGLDVVVAEKDHAGAGASGGLLGALMPHMPDQWNDKKQFQFDALCTIGNEIALLEGDTSLDCGFRRCGRVVPFASEHMLGHLAERIAGAKQHWRCRDQEFSLWHRKTIPTPRWPMADAAPFGMQYDDLAARVDPRLLIAALVSDAKRRCRLLERTAITDISTAGAVTLASGLTITASHVVVANGYAAYDLLEPVIGFRAGFGVKGQAVSIAYDHGDQLPIVYDNGTYIVPQQGGRVAIGSTSTRDFLDPSDFDNQDIEFLERAWRLVPQLRGQPVLEKWASVRPRNFWAGKGREPLLGPLPGQPRLLFAVGGFKITFAIAHLMAQVLVDGIIGNAETAGPESYSTKRLTG